jgi:glycosyltransferase involved in cell wall biosynthesis
LRDSTKPVIRWFGQKGANAMTNSSAVSSDGTAGPLVTVAVPTFNRASWLNDCILSILAQSYEKFEVVISDNASTDETQKVLREFHDPRLRVVTQKDNIGIMANWNACLAEAKGDYIVFVSDDDRIAPWLLERCISLVISEPQLSMVLALNDIRLTAESRTLSAVASKTLTTGIYEGSEILLEYLKGRISVQMCSLMVRTDILRQAGGFPVNLSYAGDTVTWCSLLLNDRAGLVNESCATYSCHDGSETSGLAVESRLKSNRTFVETIEDAVANRIDDPNKGEEISRYARRYAAHGAVGIVTSYRRKGAALTEVVPIIWQWRRELGHIGLAGIGGLVRPMAILLLPRRLTGWFGELRRKLRAQSHLVAGRHRTAPMHDPAIPIVPSHIQKVT